MLSIINSCALAGIDAYPVTVEVDITPGLPGFSMVGLPDSAVKESRERVFAALKNSGFAIPSRRITVNLAPGGVRKEGTSFDLPLALGILQASDQVELGPLQGLLFLGELSLDGGLRPVRGALPAAVHVKESGLRGLVVPEANGEEAQLVGGPTVLAAGNLLEVVRLLRDPASARRKPAMEGNGPAGDGLADFDEVKGQAEAKRALEIAAAGGHNFLMIGSPGCGKTLMARRFPSILPVLSEAESLEATRIYSVAGLLRSGGTLMRQRPFRAPHHSASVQALVGGGGSRPGEISLAHNGVLFLDVFPEFHRNVLESLRQPMEEGMVTISRVSGLVSFPSRFILGAAMNPCPCGHATDPRRKCQCQVEEIIRYRARISGPMLDRIDIHLELPGLSFLEMEAGRRPESSHRVRARVEAARGRQMRRFQTPGRSNGIYCNAHMSSTLIPEHCRLGAGARNMLRGAVQRFGLSARAYDRILKVARTIADLDGKENIGEAHLKEAIHFRALDRRLEPFA